MYGNHSLKLSQIAPNKYRLRQLAVQSCMMSPRATENQSQSTESMEGTTHQDEVLYLELAQPSEVPNGQMREEQRLGKDLRVALHLTAVGQEKYMPINDLDKIVTKERVRQALVTASPPFGLDKIDSYVDQICEVPPNEKTTRRRIFAILSMLAKVSRIVHFIQETIYDSDLPFILSGTDQVHCKCEDGSLRSIKAFTSWQTHEMEYFISFQWQFLAPYFCLSTEENPKILHYNFENRIILPYIEEDRKDNRIGGYGDVWRVKIHPAHHNHCDDSVRLLPFSFLALAFR